MDTMKEDVKRSLDQSTSDPDKRGDCEMGR